MILLGEEVENALPGYHPPSDRVRSRERESRREAIIR